jgi:hypothetical protein
MGEEVKRQKFSRNDVTRMLTPLSLAKQLPVFIEKYAWLHKVRKWNYKFQLILYTHQSDASLSCIEISITDMWRIKFRVKTHCSGQIRKRQKTSQFLNELCFWTLSIVWCLKNKQNWGIKNVDKISQYTRPHKSHKDQLLTREQLTGVWLASRVYVCMRPGKLLCG